MAETLPPNWKCLASTQEGEETSANSNSLKTRISLRWPSFTWTSSRSLSLSLSLSLFLILLSHRIQGFSETQANTSWWSRHFCKSSQTLNGLNRDSLSLSLSLSLSHTHTHSLTHSLLLTLDLLQHVGTSKGIQLGQVGNSSIVFTQLLNLSPATVALLP